MISDFTNRTLGRTARTEISQSALKKEQKFPFKEDPDPVIVEEDPEVRKRHIMICSHKNCKIEATGNCYMKFCFCTFGCQNLFCEAHRSYSPLIFKGKS